MRVESLTSEDELLILQKGLESEFWKLIEGKFRPKLQKSLRVFTSSAATPQDRDRLAERMGAMMEILDYPQERIATITTIINRKESDDS